MTINVKNAIQAILKYGAQKSDFQREGYDENLAAFVWQSAPVSKRVPFLAKWHEVLRSECVTLFDHFYVKPAQKGENIPGRYVDDIWLVLDAGLETQRAIIDRFVSDQELVRVPVAYFSKRVQQQFDFDIERLVAELILDQKRILELMSKVATCAVKSVVPGGVLLRFRAPNISEAVAAFFPEVIAFMRKYDRFELNEKTWRKMILQNQEIKL